MAQLISEQYWTQPEQYSPEDFDISRYTSDNLSYWVPHFIRLGRIERAHRILDVGCGTGGFTISIAQQTNAHLVGYDISVNLIEYAKKKPGAERIEWVLGNAEELQFSDCSFDCIILSLVLHQIGDRRRALSEAYRVLKNTGVLVIRTISPKETAKRVPFRFFPRVAEIEANRMPRIRELLDLLCHVGFERTRTEIIQRNKALNFAEVAESVRNRTRPSYALLSEAELEQGIRKMQHEWEQNKPNWIDSRPVIFLVAEKRVIDT